jgi:glycosyltransferase involved in cell wall biosynthesis
MRTPGGAIASETSPTEAASRERIALVRWNYYRADALLRRQAAALVAHGYAVDVLCPREPGTPAVEQLGGIRVLRVGSPKYRGERLALYARAYASFFWHALAALTRLHHRRPYAAVQVYSMPEALVFTALWPRLTGAPLIYAAADLTTELYASKFGGHANALAAALLRLQERVCLRLADLVITVHEDYRQRLLARGVPPERLLVVLNLPDEGLFHHSLRDRLLAAAPRASDEFVLVYHGSLVERYGADLLVRAVGLLRERIPGLRLRIYGDGDLRPRLVALVEELGLADRVYLSPGYVLVEEIPPLVATADVGVVPTRADPFTQTILPTKLLEYLALGLPSVATRTRTVLAHVPAEAVEYCAPDDPAALAASIERLWADPARRQALAAAGLAWTATHNWASQAAAYCAAVDALIARRRQPASSPA